MGSKHSTATFIQQLPTSPRTRQENHVRVLTKNYKHRHITAALIDSFVSTVFQTPERPRHQTATNTSLPRRALEFSTSGEQVQAQIFDLLKRHAGELLQLHPVNQIVRTKGLILHHFVTECFLLLDDASNDRSPSKRGRRGGAEEGGKTANEGYYYTSNNTE